MAKMRARSDGGCSICYAKDENVGKRRCRHILDAADLAIRHDKGLNFIDISGQSNNEDISISIKANEAKIKSFITNLSSGLSEKDHQNILSILRED